MTERNEEEKVGNCRVVYADKITELRYIMFERFEKYIRERKKELDGELDKMDKEDCQSKEYVSLASKRAELIDMRMDLANLCKIKKGKVK